MGGGPYYLLNALNANSSAGNLQDGGSAPSAATFGTGWRVGTTASSEYSLLLVGTRRAATTFGATALPSTFPTLTASDSFQTPTPLSGTFASGNWTIEVGVIGNTVTLDGAGNLEVRVWASADPTGTTGVFRELTSGAIALSSASNITTTVEQDTSATWAAPTVTLNGEYVFFQFAWEITGASSGTTAGVELRQGALSVITPTTFTPAPMGAIQTRENDSFTIGSTVNVITQAYTRQPQTAGNCNVIAMIIVDATTTVTGVTDTSGNVYQEIAPRFTDVGGVETVTHTIWAAPNIKAAAVGANTVTVNLSATTNIEMIIAEYFGVTAVTPVPDGVGTGSGVGTTATATSLTTSIVPELMFELAVMVNGTGVVGSGFTLRENAGANTIVGDRLLTTLQSLAATMTQATSDQWSIQSVLLRSPQSITPGPFAPPLDAIFYSTDF